MRRQRGLFQKTLREAVREGTVQRFILFIIMFLSMFFSPYFTAPLFAVSEEEKTFLSLYFKEEELQIISSTRSLKSITRVAENVTVVTAEEIELMNAHTVAEVLNTVSGVQIDSSGGPGSIVSYEIQGSGFLRVAVFIDGVSITSISENVATLGFLPVQYIERIEIIKGPASSTWGSSLGGVINIITKSADGLKNLNGMLSASYGEQNTGDFRFEARGRKNRFGYYLYAGRLQSDGMNGLRPNNDVSENTLFTKVAYGLTDDTNIQLTVLYNQNTLGRGEFREFDFADFFKNRNLMSSLSLDTSLTKELTLNILLNKFMIKSDFNEETITTNKSIYNTVLEEDIYGASARLTWKNEKHTVVAGTEYNDGTVDYNLSDKELKLKKWALFINDTFILNKLAITPGLRYDHTDPYSDFTSPSLGITYEVFDSTILRAYIAKGFHLPGLARTVSSKLMGYMGNRNIEAEKVCSYQVGLETGALKYFWIKVSAFRHDIKNVIVDNIFTDDPNESLFWTSINRGSQRLNGLEVEMKSQPVYDTVFYAGAMFIDINGANDDATVPKYTYDIGLQYDDGKSLKALLKGHYVWWINAFNGKYNAFVFDTNIIKNFYKGKNLSFEAFFTGHNIFNAAQYDSDFFKNTRRWIEAGVRVKF